MEEQRYYMSKKYVVLVQLYGLPIMAILMAFYSWLIGGTGILAILAIDVIVYLINSTLVYLLMFFLINFYKTLWRLYLSCLFYFIILVFYTYNVNFYLLILLIPMYLHLFFKTPKGKAKTNLNKSLLHYGINNLPQLNIVMLVSYSVIVFLVAMKVKF